MSETATAEPIEKVVVIDAASLPEGESRQPAEDSDQWTPEHALRPPEDLDQLARLTQASRTRRSCIEAITLNTVGLGVEVVPREGHEEEARDGEAAEVLARLDALSRRDKRLGSPSFKRLLQAVKWDEEEVGNGYIEVSRNRVTGEIDGLFHAPGKRVRRRSDRTGWVIGPKHGGLADRVEFYDFGSKVRYSGGKPESRLEGAGKRWDRNELIPFRLYTSESRDYGLPRDTQLVLDYLGDRNAAEANVGFFDSSGVPPTVIFIQGESEDTQGNKVRFQVSDRTVKAITDTLKADVGKRHRIAVVPVPPGTRTDSIDLATLSERDMGFVEYRKDNRRATLGAFRLSPIFVADIEDTNYSTAEVERRVTKEQVFDPEQDRWEDILSETILRDLGYPHLRIKLNELDVTDDQVARESANDLADHQAITYGEYRKAHGQAPLPEAADGAEPEPGQVPNGWNGMLVKVSSNSDAAVHKGAEAAARLLAEGQAGGALGGL